MKKYFLIIFLLFGFILHGCATAPSSRYVGEEALLKDLCRDFDIRWSWDNVNQTVTLSRGGITAKALMGSSRVVVDGRRITLSGPIKRRSGLVFVPYDFRSKVITPFLKTQDYAIKEFGVIVVDAGHGGKDPGAIGRTGLKEKVVVLNIAKRLKKNLEIKGFKVKMTRKFDKFISLEERARFANRSKADLFISIHANASPSRKTSGFEVYYLKDLDYLMRRDMHKQENHKAMFNTLAMEKNKPILNKILLDILYANKQSRSKRLARQIASDTTIELHSKNRGYKMADFSVLRNTLIPAILVEVGFLSNRNEERLLNTNSYCQKIADSLTESILEYAKK